MKKKKQIRTNPVNVEKYQEAFTKFFGCGCEDIETRELFENGPVLIKFKDQLYEVDSSLDMYNHIKLSLTCKDEAMLIPLEYWIEVAEEVHLVPDFIEKLTSELNGVNEFEMLNIAITISTHASKSAKIFWNTIYSLDDTELYPKAILAASQTYDLECMIEELLELMVDDGIEMFNEMQDGIFESIDLNEDTSLECTTDEGLFYIYNKDVALWDVIEKKD